MMSLMMTTVAGAAAIAIASVVHVRAPFKTFDVHSVDLLSNSRNSSVSIQIPEPPCAIIAVFAVSSFTYLHTAARRTRGRQTWINIEGHASIS